MTATRQQTAPIRCAGDSYQLGRAQGRAAAQAVRDCRDILRQLEAFQLLRPRWLPHGLFVRLSERRADRLARTRLAATAPEMVERARGIADGAGMRPASLYLLNVLEPMISDLRSATEVPALGGCSAIAVSRDASADGGPIVARNFDYLPLIQPFYMLRESIPERGLRTLEFTCAPLAGAIDGINEAGLCIACNYAYAADEPTYAGTITMAVSDALTRCRTVADAASTIAERERWGGGLLMLADESGDVASLELSNGRWALRRPGDGDGGVVFHTNRFSAPAMREVELADGAAYSDRAPTPLRGRVVHDSSTDRDARFGELLAGRAKLSIDDVAEVMADHGAEDSPSLGSICMHSAYWNTTATLQFFPRERRMRVAFDSACNADFTDLLLGA